MGENYALMVLKLERDRVKKRNEGIQHLADQGEQVNQRELTKMKHQLYDLDYSIELLSDHFNDEA